MVLRAGQMISFGLRDELFARVARSVNVSTSNKFTPGNTPAPATQAAGNAPS
jgi:hypothetical protein